MLREKEAIQENVIYIWNEQGCITNFKIKFQKKTCILGKMTSRYFSTSLIFCIALSPSSETVSAFLILFYHNSQE